MTYILSKLTLIYISASKRHSSVPLLKAKGPATIIFMSSHHIIFFVTRKYVGHYMKSNYRGHLNTRVHKSLKISHLLTYLNAPFPWGLPSVFTSPVYLPMSSSNVSRRKVGSSSSSSILIMITKLPIQRSNYEF